jgi:hypothetical protein
MNSLIAIAMYELASLHLAVTSLGYCVEVQAHHPSAVHIPCG